MSYIQTIDRTQMMMCSWDALVAEDSTARLVDAFVNSLNLKEYKVKEAAKEGRPSYDPKGLFKLYIYGSCKGVRSSRKLAEQCKINIEVIWMMGGVTPDFRTISDFRKDNISSLKKIFHEFTRRLSGAVKWGFLSVDGSKFAANNSKNANFTKNKLDDRITWLNAHMDEYLRILDDTDKQEDEDEITGQLVNEVIKEKREEAKERLEKYGEYQETMEETGASQLSLTDEDARLMKSKNGFMVAYNPQTAVDSENHLIRDFHMTNQVTDHGMLMPTLEGIREETDGVIEVVADKGYEQSEDMVKCLENGIIPHVIMDDGKDEYELEMTYEEAEETDVTSTDAKEIKKCLHAGEIPEAYKEVITDIEVKEVRRMVIEEHPQDKQKSPYGTPEEMMEKAKEGFFVRDPERNLVYCPQGEILRPKSIKKNGNIRYCNKNACKHCPNRNRCYKGAQQWKEIDFSKDCLQKPCKGWNTEEAAEVKKKPIDSGAKRKFQKIKIVRLKFRPDRAKMTQRMCISEHPFGTIKRSLGSTFFLLRGMEKVEGEFALFCLGYNITRAKNLIEFNKMMELMAGA